MKQTLFSTRKSFWYYNFFSTKQCVFQMVFVNTSGGGLRSALWTVHVLSHLDSITNQEFFKQTHMITGASGGMIGAGFFREQYLEKLDSNISLKTQNTVKKVSNNDNL